ncbi:MAG: hypothetical protein HY562_10820 [Ignavibacteriales bacterium]|nr:hypothetical protein [Ignavibacteriales bacterium]
MMKSYAATFLICATLAGNAGAQKRMLVEVSPLIGDTLDAHEEILLKIFPGLDGFQSAVFYQDPRNATVEAEILIEDKFGSRVKLLKVGTLSFLRQTIESRADVNFRDKVNAMGPVKPTSLQSTDISSITQKLDLGRDESKDKTIIVSNRVGEEIAESEREYFRLFPIMKDFHKLVFYLTPEGTYYGRFTILTPGGAQFDSLRLMTRNYLSMLSEQIDNYEEFIAGRYVMGSSRPTLHILGGLSLARPEERVESAKSTVSDILPLDYTSKIGSEESTMFAFGVSASWFSPDFSGLKPAYQAIEDFYRQQGFAVSHHEPNVDLSFMYSYTLRLRLAPYTVVIEAGRNFKNEPTFKSLSVTGLYHLDGYEDTPLRPFIGLGVGRYYFKVVQPYRNLIGPPESYRYLDDITSEGTPVGYSLLAGVGSAKSSQSSIEFWTQYVFMQELQATSRNNETAKLNLSSFIIGIQVVVDLF